MGIYEVVLGVDCAARDSGRRLTMTVCERDPLSAAITAEQLADKDLDSPVEYTHTMAVRCLKSALNIIQFPQLPALMPAA